MNIETLPARAIAGRCPYCATATPNPDGVELCHLCAEDQVLAPHLAASVPTPIRVRRLFPRNPNPVWRYRNSTSHQAATA